MFETTNQLIMVVIMMDDGWYWVVMTIMIHGSGFWSNRTKKNAEKVWFLHDFSMSMYELSSHQSFIRMGLTTLLDVEPSYVWCGCFGRKTWYLLVIFSSHTKIVCWNDHQIIMGCALDKAISEFLGISTCILSKIVPSNRNWRVQGTTKGYQGINPRCMVTAVHFQRCWNILDAHFKHPKFHNQIYEDHGRSPKIPGWWYTYPSEKWWSSLVGMMKFPTEWKVIQIPWFQSPPTRIQSWIVNLPSGKLT